MNRILALVVLATAFSATTAHAQATAGSAAVNDWLFAEAAAVSGMAEVTLSEIGLKKATDGDLKKFSQEMIDEHTHINRELAALAAQKRIALPRQVDARAQFCSQSIAGLSQEHFDRCYAKAQCIAHMEAVAAFEAEADRGQDPDMKAFASKYLPRIKEHLNKIKPMAMKYEKEERSDKDARSDEKESRSDKDGSDKDRSDKDRSDK